MKIIPIFIPHAGCPYKCIYCDQNRISGAMSMPAAEDIEGIIEHNLKTIPKDEQKEAAFFGGTFTFLPDSIQETYLESVYPYVRKGLIHSLRMSTHPEAVSSRAMKRFKKKGGRLVELGIQSLDKEVLRDIKREVSYEVVQNAGRRIKKAGLKLGVQVMLGLPCDTLERSIRTARRLIKLNPETARIYPAVVIEGTELAERFKEKRYRPLTLDEAIGQAARLSDIFEDAGVRVIRIGLHPSKGLDSKKVLLAGPYHPAFGEMVRSRQMRDRIIRVLGDIKVPNRSFIRIYAPGNMFNFISGHKKAEKKFLGKIFDAPVLLKKSYDARIKILDARRDIAVIDPRMPQEAKQKLRRLNYYVKEVPLHGRLPGPVRGHVDMMFFKRGRTVIYEPHMEDIALLLRQNGYRCLKGAGITSPDYPNNIIYNACSINGKIIHYKGKIEKNIKNFKGRFIPVKQGYVKCSVVPVDKTHIITSDKGISDAWQRAGGNALLVRPGYVRLPGYTTGFIGGTSGTDDRRVFFTGRLDSHPDGPAIRDFVKGRDKGIIELYDGQLYDVGTVHLFKAKSRLSLLELSP